MKKISIILLFSVSIFASNTIYYPSKFQNEEIFLKGNLRNMDLKTFCRNGLQWIYIQDGNKAGGLSLDYKLRDNNNPARGIIPITCNY